MTLNQATLSTVHRMLPNPRAVTLTPQNPVAAAVSVAKAYRRPWSRDDLQFSPVALETERATWLLPAEWLSSTVPKPGDLITDNDGYYWIILGRVDRELEGSVFRCVCCKSIGTP